MSKKKRMPHFPCSIHTPLRERDRESEGGKEREKVCEREKKKEREREKERAREYGVYEPKRECPLVPDRFNPHVTDSPTWTTSSPDPPPPSLFALSLSLPPQKLPTALPVNITLSFWEGLDLRMSALAHSSPLSLPKPSRLHYQVYPPVYTRPRLKA